ncbi:MerR family transcriptional regulator [Pontibacter sp. KCTC 32443]|uniref:MerR family transcriptional regulator n=1 Tax=Pontibacter TaxID=323449 RepID=UPI00164DA6F1|nr:MULTISPECIES: MerR family transcriptional regulator [Pontibacter]MBC5775026.1 MerR family transcriptional regulator [Pontibacter sp. KCTC 32443]
MAQYTIKELEHLSGIKAHTIRIWEQRYNILCPKRTETNIRYYDDKDLKTLLNVSLLNEKGYKISKIAQMQPEQMIEKVQQLCEIPGECSQHINNMMAAMLDLDEEAFDKAISTVSLQLGFAEAMNRLIYPFLHKIGILWQTGNITPAHEHFVSNLIRQKLIVAIDGQVVRRQPGASSYLLYLPEGELHELALLYMNYVIRMHNQHVIYMGQNLPFSDLELTYSLSKPEFICTVLTSAPERDQVQNYLYKLAQRFPETTIYIYGLLVQQEQLQFPENVKRLACMREFTKLFS